MLLFLSHCNPFPGMNDIEEPEPYVEPYVYEVPENVEGGWEVDHLENAGMKMEHIQELFQKHNEGEFEQQHAVLIIKDGKLVVEEYYRGWDYFGANKMYTLTSLHSMMSVSKSFISALIGISIDQGFINDIDEKLSLFFPDHQQYFIDGKSQISLKNALNMQAGIKWANNNDIIQEMIKYDSYIDFILSQPMDSIPGEKFQYSDGVTISLGAVLHNATGIRADEYIKTVLFEPIGIKDSRWIHTSKKGELAAGWGLFLRPRDMARFGQLYLNKGLWNGKQIISSDWIKKSTEKSVFTLGGSYDSWSPGVGYAYQWWCHTFNVNGELITAYAADGNGGQMIFVVDQLNMVVVFTAGHYDDSGSKPLYQMEKYILPAAM